MPDVIPIYSGFSITTGSWLSAAIRWFTDSPDTSHAFLVYWSTEYGCWMTVGANSNGVTELPVWKFESKRRITHLFRPVGFSLLDGLRKHVGDLNKSYAWSALLDMAWISIERRLRLHPQRNVLELRGELFCSQWIAEIIKDSLGTFQWMRWPLVNTSASIIDPGLLYRSEAATASLFAAESLEVLHGIPGRPSALPISGGLDKGGVNLRPLTARPSTPPGPTRPKGSQ
jgi:hypothetical protein